MQAERSRSLVIVVDDERLIANSLGAILRMHGYVSAVFYSAEEVLSVPGIEPHLAVIDVILPGLNGYELAKKLAVACPLCEIILLSGHPEAASLRQAAGISSETFTLLPKPCQPDLLLATIASALGNRASGSDDSAP